MQVKAQAKFLRMSPQKVRLVLGLVRGLPVAAAKQQLQFSSKEAARAILKVLDSAVANARHNAAMDVSGLFVTQAFADEGPKIHRFRPRARGSAAPIRKRMSHVTIFVGAKEEIGVLKQATGAVAEKPVEKKTAAKAAPKKAPAKKKTVSKKNA